MKSIIPVLSVRRKTGFLLMVRVRRGIVEPRILLSPERNCETGMTLQKDQFIHRFMERYLKQNLMRQPDS